MQAEFETAYPNCGILVFPNMDEPNSTPDAKLTWHDPQRHGNWAQIATVFIAVLAFLTALGTLWFSISSRSADREAKASDDHVNTLIDAKVGPLVNSVNKSIDKKLGPISQQLMNLNEQMGKLEGRFQQLDSEHKRLTRLQLDKLSGQISGARKAGKRIDLERLAHIGEDVISFASSDDSGISQLAWKVTNELSEYKSFLNASFSPQPTSTTPLPKGFTFEARARLILPPSQPQRSILGIVGFGPYVPEERAARFQPIDENFPYKEAPQYFIVEGKGFEVSIDGYQIKNAIIRNTRIKYEGGIVQLENVYFVNCTFDLAKDRAGENFAIAVLSPKPATTFRVG